MRMHRACPKRPKKEPQASKQGGLLLLRHLEAISDTRLRGAELFVEPGTYAHTNANMRRRTCTYIHRCMHTCIHAYICIHAYMHTYMHAYMHTYILVHVRESDTGQRVPTVIWRFSTRSPATLVTRTKTLPDA